MTPEELGKLFPIKLVDHKQEWSDIYKAETDQLKQTLGEKFISKMHHIGSTAIRGIKAKDCIDILIELNEKTVGEQLQKFNRLIRDCGYDQIARPDNPPPHLMFAKGYTINGFVGQAFHVHIRYEGIQDEIIFREYLRKHPDSAKEYEKLKIKLAIEHQYNREHYTDAKTSFITQILNSAKQ